MIRIPSALVLLAAGLSQAHASDMRIRSVFYDPKAIVTIVGRPNIETAILFAPDEHVENVAIGDSAAWQVTPNKRASLLFIKPQQPHGRTNLTVVTDQRTYLFDLVAGPKGGSALYKLQFTYPALPPQPPVPPAPFVKIVALPPPPSPAELNFHWAAKGDRKLLPRRVFDDGRSVYLAWDPDVALPALLSVSAGGIEGPVNSHVKGEFLVVDGIPGRLVLRSGKSSASLDRIAGSVARETSPTSQTAER